MISRNNMPKPEDLVQDILETKTDSFSELVSIACLDIKEDLVEIDLSGESLSCDNLSGANFRNADLSSADLSGINLSNANLSGANLSGANLCGANLSGANLSGANLSGAKLVRAFLGGAKLDNANLINAQLIRANLSSANLNKANLTNADLTRANLHRASLNEANLTSANLIDTVLLYTDLKDANLEKAQLTQELVHSKISNIDTLLDEWTNLSTEDRSWMINAGTNMELADGEVLLHQGVEVSALYIILHGCLSVSIEKSSRKQRITTLFSGELVGEMSFVNLRPASATIEAVQNTTVWLIPREKLITKVTQDREFGYRFIKAIAAVLSKRLLDTTIAQLSREKDPQATLREVTGQDSLLGMSSTNLAALIINGSLPKRELEELSAFPNQL